jgi:cell division protein FtsW
MFSQIFKRNQNEKHPDYILLTTTIILIVLGILILASASAHISPRFLGRQIIFGLLPGLFLAFLVFKINLDFLRKIVPILLLINLILLSLVFIPGIGVEAWGATRWIGIGPISFQPSEFLKITFVLYLANWLAIKTSSVITTKNRIEKNFRKEQKRISENFIAFLIFISLISLFLIFQPNISTLAIIILTVVLIYFLAHTPLWHTVLILLMGFSFLIFLIKIAPYRLERLTVFLNPGIDSMGIGFQMQQALITIGSGGIWGTGLGMGIQKFGFLPGAIADSIFAVFAEEAGFIGSIILILLFLIFLWRGFRIAKLSQNKFSQLTAYGITIWIIIQAFVNIGSMLGVLPLTGIPLPFISHGGTALVTTLVGVGILLNISKQE